MVQTSGEQEGTIKAETGTWQWEVVKDPTDLLNMINVTIQERVMQNLTVAAGFAELAGSENPQYAQHITENANIAKEAALEASQQLRAIQIVIEMDRQQPLPIDRTTYPNQAFIVLDQVSNPGITATPPSNSPK